MIVWFSGRTVRNTNELTNQMANLPEKQWRNMDKNGKYGGFMEQNEVLKNTIHIGARKELIY